MEPGAALPLITLLLSSSSVLSRIEFLATPKNTAVVFGQDTSLHCSAQDLEGTGTLLYRWEFRNGPLSRKTSVFGNNTLLITRTEQSDLGEYTCNVTREDTQETISRSAVVVESYTQDFLAQPKSVETPLGETAELTCITGQVAPNPAVFWEKDGRVYSGGRQVNASYGDADPLGLGFQYSLRLSLTVDESSAGVYRCVARNLLSQVTKGSDPAFLTIKVPDVPPSIEVAPPAEVYAPEGQPYSIDCVITGTPPPQIFWRRDGVDVRDGSRVAVLANGTLTFQTVELRDAGIYLCQGRNAKGSVSTGYMSLHVPYLGLTFRQQPRDVHAVAGQTARVFCTPPDSDPPATVTWYRGNAPYQTQTGEFATSVDRTTAGAWDLRFANVQQADVGDYFCVAFNNYTSPQSRTSRVARLSVTGGALFLEPPVGQDLIKGELLQLKCVVQGNPVPVITWSKDGEPLRLSSRVSLVKSRQELYIASVTKPDEGTYLCNVANGFNNISASAFVRVRVPPAILSQIGQVTINLGVSSEVTLPCVVNGDPAPDVTWFHDGEEITNSDRRRILDDRLKIQGVTVEDSGNYTCHATNSAGDKSVTGNIAVIAPPRFTVTPVNQSVTLGVGVTLRCEVTGVPAPTINWTFNDSQPLPSSHIVSSDLTVVTIATMKWEDAGKYSCFASNSAAQVVTSGTLTVQTIPEVLNVTGKTVLPRGDDLELYCEVRGVPDPSINWLFQGQTVTSSLNGRISVSTKNTLSVKFTAEADSGNYSCVSQNSAGQDVDSLQVTVYGPPLPPVLESVDPVSTTSVNVSWSAVAQSPYADVNSFIIHYKESFASDFRLYRDNIHPALISVELGGLRPAVQYVVVMAAKNDAGEGNLSSALAATTFESGPSEPRALRVANVGSQWISLTWEVPESPQGQIRLYQVTYTDTADVSGEMQSVLVTSPILPLQKFTLEDLKPHTTYNIQVRAATDLENGAPVWGNYSEQIQVTTLYSAPSGSPQNLTLSSVGSRSFTVAWQPVAPGDSNGPIKNYVVEYTSTVPLSINQSASADATKNEVTIVASVFPWRQYHVTVRAVNEAGSGPASDPLTFTTSPDAPSGSPQEVKATSLAGEAILVEWKPVALPDRNGPIRGYVVKFGVTTEELRSYINISSPDALSTVIRDVLPFTLYDVAVQAYTSEVHPGQGPYSAPVQVMTSQTVPGPVRNVTYTVSPEMISLTWLPPEVATGPLKQYTVHYQPQNKASDKLLLVAPSDQTAAVIDNLKADTMYTVEIFAENGAGQGEVIPLSIKTAQLGSTSSPTTTNKPQGPLGNPSPLDEKPTKHLAAIVAGSLTGGLFFIFVIAVVAYWCLKRRCKTSEERYYLSKVDEDSDSVSDTQIKSSSSSSEIAPPSPTIDPTPGPSPNTVTDSIGSTNGEESTYQLPSNNNNEQGRASTLPQSAKEKKLSGLDNAAFLDSTLGTREGSIRLPPEQVYAQVNRSGKKQYSMRAEAAAAIAVERNRGIQVLTGDKDLLIDNEAEIVYDERTTL